MALTHVQTLFTNAAASPVSVTLTLTAGNAVLVSLLTYVVPTQTAGDTLTQDASAISGGDNLYLFSNLSVAGGSTTFTFTTASGAMSMWVTEVSGLATSAAFDQTANTTFSLAATRSTGTTPTTIQADEFLLGIMHGDTSGSNTLSSVSNGFTVPTNGDRVGAAGGNARGAIAYKIVAATGAYETTFTMTDPESAHALIGTYKAAAAFGRGLHLAGSIIPNLRW